MKVNGLIEDSEIVKKILKHLRLWDQKASLRFNILGSAPLVLPALHNTGGQALNFNQRVASTTS